MSEWECGCPKCGGSNYIPKGSWQVMPDIAPFKSMVDGSWITSRGQKNAHYRAHGMVEVGNDSSLYRKPQPLKSPPGLKEAVIRATEQVEQKLRYRRK